VHEDQVTVTIKFRVNKDKLNDFFKSIANLGSSLYSLYDLYWVDGINYPVIIEEAVKPNDPIRNVTGY
jgi:hypothetical protein